MTLDQSFALVDAEGRGRELPLPEIVAEMEASANTVVVSFADRSAYEVGYAVLVNLPRIVEVARSTKRERRIEALVEAFLDVDPFEPVQAQIDADNAMMRGEFLQAYPVLESAAIHARAGHSGRNTAQTAASWKRVGRIFSVPHGGRELYPAFQFDADGQPLPLHREVLATLPADLSPWQRAFWMVAPSDELRGEPPIDLVRRGDRRVIEAAREAGRLPVG